MSCPRKPPHSYWFNSPQDFLQPLDPGRSREADFHGLDRLRIVIHQDEVAPQFKAGGAGGAASGEEIQHGIAGVGRSLHDTAHNAERFLGGVAGLLAPIGGYDGMPPGVGGQFAFGGFFRPHQAGRHIGDALNGIHIIDVVIGVLGVPEDVVVLGGPLFLRAGAYMIL